MKPLSLDLVISGRVPSYMTAVSARKTVRKTLAALGLRSAILGLAFLSEEKMAEKNKKYRKLNRPTDVLSFAYPVSKKILSGDILICPAYASKQAKERSIPVGQEMKRLLVHGLLHLAGMDHAKEKEAVKMFGLQEKIVKSI
ncbi:MAG: rRNA maturation RNase YbeY [Patescibacteria group bacterium]|nr:rRNA maturation RNase YbeY [Patescibacteria group bacterium]